ncbi:lipase family protein [Endozoicomonas montiporae]|nr:lipase family protein [Endozoicomonas montiporae]
MQPDQPIKSDIFRIYIEGDGKAWMRSGRPSPDPTPVNRLVHQLMLQDPKPEIAYLARPCQFSMEKGCTPHTWTFGRYSNSVANSMNDAISSLKHQYKFKTLELVGYSGGATIALLIAARRDDVISVRTIAGNLDPAFTNHFHRVSPMPDALNPIRHINELKQVPQIHFYGKKDSVITGDVSRHYVSRFPEPHCIKTMAIEGANHHDGWTTEWAELLEKEIPCHTKKAHIK